MYALALVRYRRPLEEVLTVSDAHRAYLMGLKDRGLLLASGPLSPRTGGALLLSATGGAWGTSSSSTAGDTVGGAGDGSGPSWPPKATRSMRSR